MEQGGAIIGSTINKYAYCSIVPRDDDHITVHSLDLSLIHISLRSIGYEGKSSGMVSFPGGCLPFAGRLGLRRFDRTVFQAGIPRYGFRPFLGPVSYTHLH